MSEERALTPVEQREVEFYEDSLTAVRASDGQVYVAIGQMCDSLGLNRASQTRRIRSDDVLSDGYRGAVNLTYPDGGTQPSGVLRVDLIPLWLSGIRIKAVREDIAPKLLRFKREAAAVLWEAFQDGRLTTDTTFDDLLDQDTDAVQAYKVALAVVRLARNQILLEAKVDSQGEQIAAVAERLEAVEGQLGSGRTITPDQATSISQAVKAVARELGKATKRNEYGGVYGELYRRYRIPGYRELPADKFDDAMRWLAEWYEDLTGKLDIPF